MSRRLALGYTTALLFLLSASVAAAPTRIVDTPADRAPGSAKPDQSVLIATLEKTRAEIRSLRIELARARIGEIRPTGKRATSRPANLAGAVAAMRAEWESFRLEAARARDLLRLCREQSEQRGKIAEEHSKRAETLDKVGARADSSGVRSQDPKDTRRGIRKREGAKGRSATADGDQRPLEIFERVLRKYRALTVRLKKKGDPSPAKAREGGASETPANGKAATDSR